MHFPQIPLSLRKNGKEESRLLNLRRLRSSRPRKARPEADSTKLQILAFFLKRKGPMTSLSIMQSTAHLECWFRTTVKVEMESKIIPKQFLDTPKVVRSPIVRSGKALPPSSVTTTMLGILRTFSSKESHRN